MFKGDAPEKPGKYSQEGFLYTKLKSHKVVCGICPNHCILAPGDRSVCRSKVNLDGKLYSLTYGNPCAVNTDPIEKKPLFHFKPRTPTGFLQDGQRIELGGVTAQVLLTPGHTPGHLAFYFEEPGVLFLGDYDLTKFGPWYGDVGSSIKETVISVKQLQKIPATIWITSNEQGVFEEEPGELWDHYIDVIRLREQKLLNLLEKPRTFQEIANACIIYGKPRKPAYFFEFGEKAHMRKHLEKLIREGTVSMEDDRYFSCV